MEISDKVPPIHATPYIKEAVNNKPDDVPVPSTKGDRVELSNRAQELQSARQALQKMDDVDHDKVAAIKAQIEAGTYKVNAKKIAEKMLADSFL